MRLCPNCGLPEHGGAACPYTLTVTDGPPMFVRVECPDCKVKDARIAEPQAHFADLGKKVTAAQDECRRMTREMAVVMSAHLEEKARAEQAEAKLLLTEAKARLEADRVLKAGREEYELAVAEMNRRGEEVARLDVALRSACRKWAACCDSGVLYPPLISNAGEGLRLLIGEQPDLAARYEAGRK